MRYITDTDVVSAEGVAHGVICMFLGMWKEQVRDYNIEIRPGDVWGQLLHSSSVYDWELSAALADLELTLAQHPVTEHLQVDLSVLPCFIPRGFEP